MRIASIAGLLLGFFACQVLANLFFRYGSGTPGRWWTGFILGNLIGVSSILFFMGIQRLMPDRMALVLAICGGGSFVAVQIALSLVFRQPIAMGQYAGIAVIVLGMAMMLMFQNSNPS